VGQFEVGCGRCRGQQTQSNGKQTQSTMIRSLHRYRILHPVVCFCVEFLLINSAVMLAASMRLPVSTLVWRHAFPDILGVLLIALTCQLCMYYAELYNLKTVLSPHGLFMKFSQSIAAAAIALTIIFHFVPQLLIDHSILHISLVMIFFSLILWRIFYQKLQKINNFKSRVLILGSSKEARKIAEDLLCYQPLMYELKGFIDDLDNKSGTSMVQPKILGDYKQIQEIVERESIDKVVVALSDCRGKLPMETLLACKLHGVEVEEGATFYEQVCSKIMLENLRPSWLVFSPGFSVSPHLCFLKRLVDILVSVLGLIGAAPLMLVVALLIKIDSRGPVFYRQQRVGQNGKLFTLTKFRSMRNDAEASTGPIFADKDDCRITRVGRVIRTTRVDELPQLLNILRGEMSFVGPRPERPFFVEQFAKEIPYYSQRLSVKPGITGWAQVCYPYGATLEDAVEKLRLDLYYIKNMSLFLDLFIIMKTFKTIVLGKGAR
jgi:sugar transferase (PEP-CTERM system associated)